MIDTEPTIDCRLTQFEAIYKNKTRYVFWARDWVEAVEKLTENGILFYRIHLSSYFLVVTQWIYTFEDPGE